MKKGLRSRVAALALTVVLAGLLGPLWEWAVSVWSSAGNSIQTWPSTSADGAQGPGIDPNGGTAKPDDGPSIDPDGR